MSRIFFAGHDRGAGQLPTLGFPRPAYGADTALPFLCLSGAQNPASNSSPEFMETRGVLPSLRTVAAPADCIRPRTGNGRNRYVPAASACRGSVVNRYARAPAGAAGRDGLTWHGYYPAVLFFGLFSQFHDYNRNVISLRRHSANGKVRLLHSCELIRPKLLRPFVEFHKAIFWVGGWDPYSHPPFFESFPPII